ncbi:hypothetical protein ACWGLJ_42725, partial [Streptomyces sp. NPDC055898]
PRAGKPAGRSSDTRRASAVAAEEGHESWSFHRYASARMHTLRDVSAVPQLMSDDAITQAMA